MSRRPKPKDNQGHDPKPMTMVKFDECVVCHDVRVRGGEFRRPCPGAKHSGEYMGE